MRDVFTNTFSQSVTCSFVCLVPCREVCHFSKVQLFFVSFMDLILLLKSHHKTQGHLESYVSFSRSGSSDFYLQTHDLYSGSFCGRYQVCAGFALHFSNINCCKGYPFCSDLPLPFFQGSADHILWIFSGFSTVCCSICVSVPSARSRHPDHSKS